MEIWIDADGCPVTALTAALAAEAFLGWQVFGPVSEVLHRGDTVSLVIIAAAALALAPWAARRLCPNSCPTPPRPKKQGTCRCAASAAISWWS